MKANRANRRQVSMTRGSRTEREGFAIALQVPLPD
ncbi:hypothetical protein COLO4_22220 [Corchorus olitorius]|uniref:Uncharacterized protein n=1 Tax=Corchorus olitorius TaxID=93759 RepID=A0A1R3INI3_9ROSI|nr:hypothetical protein COLO4_22220 [Corchorus olitorius]